LDFEFQSYVVTQLLSSCEVMTKVYFHLYMNKQIYIYIYI
jgi:hypothetical protein